MLLYLLSFCTSFFLVQAGSNEATSDTKANNLPMLLFTNATHLYARGWPDTEDVQVIAALGDHKSPMAFDYDAVSKKFFFVTQPDMSARTSSKLYSLVWKNGEKMKLLRNNVWNPRSMAIDYIGKKLYVANIDDRSISVLDMNGKNIASIFEDEGLIPYELDLDPVEGLMFVLSANVPNELMQIYRMNMDGSSPEVIVTNADELGPIFMNDRIGFELDPINKRIYFANFKEEFIESVDYTGENRITVAKAKYPRSLSIFNGTLYWSDAKIDSESPFSCQLGNCQLWSCSLTASGTCNETTIKELLDGGKQSFLPQTVMVVNMHPLPTVANPCDGFKCQHHCLIRPFENDGSGKLDFRCACIRGYQLGDDQKSCDITKVTHAYDEFYYPPSMDFGDLWNPSSRQMYPMARSVLLSHTYYTARLGSDLAFPDSLQAVNGPMNYPQLGPIYFPNDQQRALKFLCEPSDLVVTGHDWVTGNVYCFGSLENEDKLGMAELKVMKYKIVEDEAKYFEATLARVRMPVSMEVHPYRGYIFAPLGDGSLMRLNTDGSGVFIVQNVSDLSLMAIDLHDDKIYWIDYHGFVNIANLDGSEDRRIFKAPEGKVNIMSVYDRWIYMTIDGQWIRRFDKMSGEEAGISEIEDGNYFKTSVAVKVPVEYAEFVNLDHPCAVNDGFCEVFCFGVIDEEKKELQKVCDKSIKDVLLFVSAKSIYFKQEPNIDKRYPIDVPERKIGPMALDYHSGKRMLYATTPKIGFWTRNAKLLAIKWKNNLSCYDPTGEDLNCRYWGIPDYAVSELREEDNWNPRSLAVDYIRGKLYIVDTNERSVNVFDLNGENKACIFENEMLIPFEIALDPPKGLMFIFAVNVTSGMMQIYRLNMDGSSAEVIVTDADELDRIFIYDKIAFGLDTTKKRIYFASFKDSLIQQVDYNGNKRLNVTKAKYPRSVTIQGNTLYWSDSEADTTRLFLCHYGDSQMCKLFSCKLDIDGVCLQDTIEEIIERGDNDFVAHSVKSINPNVQQIGFDPCASSNGGCKHHCLIKSSGDNENLDYGCACNQGYRLAADLKDCMPEKVTCAYDNFLVPDTTKYTSLENPSPNEIYPFPRNLLIQLTYGAIDCIYVQAPFRFIRVSDSGDAIEEFVPAQKDSVSLTRNWDSGTDLSRFGLLDEYPGYRQTLKRYRAELNRVVAYDYIARNIYYVKMLNEEEHGIRELMVMKYDKADRTSLKSLSDFENNIFKSMPEAFLARIPEPVSMLVHPYRGYVFSAIRNGSIIRLDSQGSNSLLLPNISDSQLLAVDLHEDKIYWANSVGCIHRANLDGSEPRRVLTSSDRIDLFYVYDKWIYTRSFGKLIRRFDKNSSTEAGAFTADIENLLTQSLGIKVPAEDARYAGADHPCAIDNGGCEMFCFAMPAEEMKMTRVCGCGKNRELSEDGLRCR